jgi:hypothetical protein
MVGFLKSEIEEKNATGACRQPRCVSGDSQESDVNAARLNVAWQTAARPDWQPPAASRQPWHPGFKSQGFATLPNSCAALATVV